MGVATSPQRMRTVRIMTTHTSLGGVCFDAGADDPLASLRAAVAARAWPGRTDFELRAIEYAPDALVLHEALDLWWLAGRPIATPDDAAALPEDAVIMAWAPEQWEGGACAGVGV